MREAIEMTNAEFEAIEGVFGDDLSVEKVYFHDGLGGQIYIPGGITE